MDYLWNTTDAAVMEQIANSFTNRIGPAHGRAAQPEGVDENGNPTPAQPAVGDPARLYVNIRSAVALVRPDGVDETDEATSAAVLGVWA